jgi:hypothetical protein
MSAKDTCYVSNCASKSTPSVRFCQRLDFQQSGAVGAARTISPLFSAAANARVSGSLGR